MAIVVCWWWAFLATTPGFGHQIDIALKIVPHALLVYLRNPIQQSIISRPFVGSRSVRKTVCWFQIGSTIFNRFCIIPTLSKMSTTQSDLWSNANINSHPVMAPYMALLVIHYELLQTATGVGLAENPAYHRWYVEGSKQLLTTFIFSRLLWSQRFLCRFFMTAIETTLIGIDCIGDHYFMIDHSESYQTSIY